MWTLDPFTFVLRFRIRTPARRSLDALLDPVRGRLDSQEIEPNGGSVILVGLANASA